MTFDGRKAIVSGEDFPIQCLIPCHNDQKTMPEMIVLGDTERDFKRSNEAHKPIYSNILFQSIIYSYILYLWKNAGIYTICLFRSHAFLEAAPCARALFRCERGDSRAQEVPAERWRPNF